MKPIARKPAKRAPSAKAITKAAASESASIVYLHVALAKRSRDGLNKLVTAIGVDGQRQVLEQLIADELHRRKLRLPRA